MAPEIDFSNPGKYPDLGRYSFSNAGFSTGQPAIDMMMAMMMGQHLTPRPAQGTTQNIMDAFISRERSMQFMKARNQALAGSLFSQRLGGINPDSAMMQLGGALFGDPDGFAMKMMSPLVGGNPVKAQMGLFGNLTGQTMGTFGRSDNISVPQTTEMMNSLYKNFYHQDTIGQGYIDKARDSATRNLVNITKDAGLQGMFNQSLNGERDFKNFSESMTSMGGGARKLSGILGDNKADMKEAGQKFLESITDPTAKAKLSDAWKDALTKGTEGKKALDALGETADDLVSNSEMVRKAERLRGQTVPTSINYNNTLGFRIEDITEGFTHAADFKLLGKRGVEESFEGFTKHATGAGVMDAARGIFGNDKSGGDLMKEISSLLGKNSYDLADPTSAGKLEELLRNVKSAARTAGISVDTILGVIEQGKAFTRMHPGLQFTGGGDIAQMAIRTTKMASALGAYYGNDYVRSQGGMTGMANNIMVGELQAQTEPITQNTAALLALMHDQGHTDAEQFIKGWAGGKFGGHTRTGYNQMVRKLSDMTGFKVPLLNSFATTNKEASARGLALAPELSDVAAISAQEELQRQLRLRKVNIPGMPGMTSEDEYYAAISGKRVDLNSYLKSGAQLDSTAQGFLQRAQSALGTGVDGVLGYMNSGSEANAGGNTAINMLQKYLNIQGYRGAKGLQQYRVDDESVFNPNMMGTVSIAAGAAYTNFQAEGKKSGYFNRMMAQHNPALRKKLEEQEAKAAEDAEMDKVMSRRLASLNAPMTTQLFQKLMDGSVDANGISALLDPLDNKAPEFTKLRGLANDMVDINLLSDAKGIAAFTKDRNGRGRTTGGRSNLMGYNIDEHHVDFLMKTGLTAEQVRTFGAANGDEALDAAIKDDPKNEALKKWKAGTLQDRRAARSILDTIDPDQMVTGDLTMKNMRRGMVAAKQKAFRDQTLQPLIDKNLTKFDDWKKSVIGDKQTGAEAKKIFSIFASEEDVYDSQDPSKRIDAIYHSLHSPEVTKFKGPDGKPLDKKTLDMVTQKVDQFKENQDKLKIGQEKETANNNMGSNIEKILKILGGDGGQSFISVLNNLNESIRRATQIGG